MRKIPDPKAIDEAWLREIAGRAPADSVLSADTLKMSAPTTDERPETKEYTAIFLQPQPIRHRVCVYISEATQRKLVKVVKILGNGVTLSAYIENILQHHLEEYRKELNAHYRKIRDKDIV